MIPCPWSLPLCDWGAVAGPCSAKKGSSLFGNVVGPDRRLKDTCPARRGCPSSARTNAKRPAFPGRREVVTTSRRSPLGCVVFGLSVGFPCLISSSRPLACGGGFFSVARAAAVRFGSQTAPRRSRAGAFSLDGRMLECNMPQALDFSAPSGVLRSLIPCLWRGFGGGRHA